MIIWVLFFAFALWVNLPSIVQRNLTNKLIYESDYTENGSLKIIEWFRLYPLKKLLCSLHIPYGNISKPPIIVH